MDKRLLMIVALWLWLGMTASYFQPQGRSRNYIRISPLAPEHMKRVDIDIEDDDIPLISNSHSCNITSMCQPCSYSEQSSQATFCQETGYRERVSCYLNSSPPTEDTEIEQHVEVMRSCTPGSREAWKVIIFEIFMMIGFFAAIYGVSVRSRLAVIAHYQRIQRRLGEI
eukprot:TRINITY_DN596_c0_g6_i1.p1 TRINITY_DN596_c0_g6~~TRINITY_DN596_c0_g6_i1.p1  ORF type:complete len:169 (-),score=14.21 TRINITY_DN596_c0_g6_i1:454-960(-)